METPKITLKTAVCREFNILEAELFRRTRKREIINARFLFIYILVDMEEKGPSAVAYHIGNITHCTVYNAIDKCNKYYRTEKAYMDKVDRVLELYYDGRLIIPQVQTRKSEMIDEMRISYAI